MKDQEVFTINDIFEQNLIEDFIQSYCYENNIEDLKKENIQTWRALCTDLGNTVFRPIKQQMKNNYKYNVSGKYASNNGAFDFFIVDLLIDIYIKLSDKYNKIQSISIFSLFSNISYQTVESWRNNTNTFINTIYDKDNNVYLSITDLQPVENNNGYYINNNIYINTVWYKGDLLTIQPIYLYKRLLDSRSNVINDKLADNNNPVALFGAQNADKERYNGLETKKEGLSLTDWAQSAGLIVQNAQTTDGGS